jgi:hypothetical protein
VPENYRKTAEPTSSAILWLARALHYQTRNIEAAVILAALLPIENDVYGLDHNLL